MNRLEFRLKELNSGLFSGLQETKEEVKLLLNEYIKNFPEYTDHSIHHTEEVFNIVDEVLDDEEISNLNADEIYVLSMSSYLHDIGMCIPEDKIKDIADTDYLLKQRELHPDIKRESYLRDIHHTLSKKFILEEWELLKIPSKKYAEAIALVSEGHRVVDIGNSDVYKPKFFVKNGREFVCLPYLSAVLRIADELDITNIRTPKLLTKYYMPENEKSIIEWEKHIANTQRNITENYVEFDVECSNHQMLASLEDQFNKIKNVINYCQKVIRNISNTENREFKLKLDQVREKYSYIGFDPKGIKYSFDVEKVVDAFVGENLYNDRLTSLREVLQNSIDTCRYKQTLEGKNYSPEVTVVIEEDKVVVQDNGLGMDEFIIKNFFGKLGSSFYQQENVKKEYEAIGNFGVGVFSYFLMSDYIDIETKTKSSETLHFRLDKDPKNYFHFFQQYNRKISGTTITLHLKDDFKSRDKHEFIEYIKNKFRFIEFPINIIYGDYKNTITRQPLIFHNLRENIYNDLNFSSKKIIDNLEFYTYQFQSKEYEGSITFVYDKDYKFLGIPEGFVIEESKIINRHGDGLKKEISQKGVLVVEDYNNFILLSNVFFLKLNLKTKINVAISRNDFSDNTIGHIINDLFIDSLRNFFKTKSLNKTLNQKFDLSSLIIEDLQLSNFIKYSDKFDDLLFFKVIKNSKMKIITFKDLKLINEQIILSNDAEFTEKLRKSHNKHLILETKNNLFLLSTHIQILSLLNYKIRFCRKDDLNYVVLDKNNFKLSLPNMENIIDADENFKTINLNLAKIFDKKKRYYYGSFYNQNHPFLINFIKHKDLIIKENKNLFEEIATIIDDIDYYDVDTKIKDLNFLVSEELSKIIKINYKFKRKDFDL